MIVNIKYFYEKSDNDYEKYNKLWSENEYRIIYLHTNLPLSKQISNIVNELNFHKDILAVRFPSDIFIRNNTIISNVILGKGFACENGTIWYPKEVWIYSPITFSSVFET